MGNREFHRSGPEILVDLANKIAHRLVTKAGLAPDLATDIAVDAALEMASDWGGQIVYFPKATAHEVAMRHLEIWRRFNGRNQAELAAQFDMSVQAIYRIVKRVGRQELAERQGDMFPPA